MLYFRVTVVILGAVLAVDSSIIEPLNEPLKSWLIEKFGSTPMPSYPNIGLPVQFERLYQWFTSNIADGLTDSELIPLQHLDNIATGDGHALTVGFSREIHYQFLACKAKTLYTVFPHTENLDDYLRSLLPKYPNNTWYRHYGFNFFNLAPDEQVCGAEFRLDLPGSSDLDSVSDYRITLQVEDNVMEKYPYGWLKPEPRVLDRIVIDARRSGLITFDVSLALMSWAPRDRPVLSVVAYPHSPQFDPKLIIPETYMQHMLIVYVAPKEEDSLNKTLKRQRALNFPSDLVGNTSEVTGPCRLHHKTFDTTYHFFTTNGLREMKLGYCAGQCAKGKGCCRPSRFKRATVRFIPKPLTVKVKQFDDLVVDRCQCYT